MPLALFNYDVNFKNGHHQAYMKGLCFSAADCVMKDRKNYKTALLVPFKLDEYVYLVKANPELHSAMFLSAWLDDAFQEQENALIAQALKSVDVGADADSKIKAFFISWMSSRGKDSLHSQVTPAYAKSFGIGRNLKPRRKERTRSHLKMQAGRYYHHHLHQFGLLPTQLLHVGV